MSQDNNNNETETETEPEEFFKFTEDDMIAIDKIKLSDEELEKLCRNVPCSVDMTDRNLYKKYEKALYKNEPKIVRYKDDPKRQQKYVMFRLTRKFPKHYAVCCSWEKQYNEQKFEFYCYRKAANIVELAFLKPPENDKSGESQGSDSTSVSSRTRARLQLTESLNWSDSSSLYQSESQGGVDIFLGTQTNNNRVFENIVPSGDSEEQVIVLTQGSSYTEFNKTLTKHVELTSTQKQN